MELYNEHAILAWLIIIGAVCLTIFFGALLDRLMHSRRQSNLRVQTKAVRVSNQSFYRYRKNWKNPLE